MDIDYNHGLGWLYDENTCLFFSAVIVVAHPVSYKDGALISPQSLQVPAVMDHVDATLGFPQQSWYEEPTSKTKPGVESSLPH